MDSLTVTYIILGAAGLAGLGCFAVLILAPAWTAYGRTWERFAAAFLSVFVLAAFVGAGLGIGLIVLYYWDQILDLFGIQATIAAPVGRFALLDCQPEWQKHARNPLPSAAQPSSAQALDALAESVESGAGLPETARRAGAALDASVALIDSRGAVLAVAAGSPAEERELLSKHEGVTVIDLRVSESVVGQLRFRAREDAARARRTCAW